MKPAPPVIRSVAMSGRNEKWKMQNERSFYIWHSAVRLHRGSLRVLQRQPQLLRQRIHRRPAPLPRAFGFEPQVADAAPPRRDDAADGAEVGAVGVLLVEAADDVRRDADERAQRRGAADAVLPPVPRAAEDLRDLLEVVDEELLRLFVHVAAASVEDAAFGEQLLQLLGERRLRNAPAADAE